MRHLDAAAVKYIAFQAGAAARFPHSSIRAGSTVLHTLTRNMMVGKMDEGGWRLTCHRCRTSCPNCLGAAQGGVFDA